VFIHYEFLYLPPLVLAFLIIDLSMESITLGALFFNIFFWLYWLVYSIAAETALYFLGNATNPTVSKLPPPVLTLIAIIGTTTVLQSITFKVGGKRVLDLSHYLDDYRRKVLTSSASLMSRAERGRVIRQSREILKKVDYKPGNPASESEMKRIYAEVMLFGARKSTIVQQEIAKIEQDCAITGASFGNEIARRVAQTDPQWVRHFLPG